MKKLLLVTALAAALLGPLSPAQPHRDASAEASALSLLPIAVSVAAPVPGYRKRQSSWMSAKTSAGSSSKE